MKRKYDSYRVDFEGTPETFNNVRVQVVPSGPDEFHFFHLEKKPNGWLALVTEGFLHNQEGILWPLEIVRHDGGNKPSFMVRNGCACPVSTYTTLTAFHGKEFYHLDQLNTGAYRLAHTTRMFGKDFVHSDVSKIVFTKEA